MSKSIENHHKELLILKTIAETLNESNDLKQMLQSTLEKLLEVTGISTGWIFLAKEPPFHKKMADYNLPPALAREDKQPMRCGTCDCLELFWKGSLKKAVNIIKCKRLHEAVEHSWGDTRNLTHHATVPLTVRGKRFGILNVGSPGKKYFNDEELTLLESVAYQIGTAVDRTFLYEREKKQFEYYAKIDELTRHIWNINDPDILLRTIIGQIGENFGWSAAGIIMKRRDRLTLQALYRDGTPRLMNETWGFHDSKDSSDIIVKAYLEQKVCVSDQKDFIFPELNNNGGQFSIAIPLKLHEMRFRYEQKGVLFISRQFEPFVDYEFEILKVLAEHISLAMEEARLYAERRQLLLTEERNRLARDLHDSVNQKLFSLSLTARGLREMLKHEDQNVIEGINNIGQLAQEALTEMRSLIWELRPDNIDKGITYLLKEYADKIGLNVTIQMKEDGQLMPEVEEAFIRIGQEALNNVRKHARTNCAQIRIECHPDAVQMVVSDEGRGFSLEQALKYTKSLGMKSMRERAAQVNGNFEIESIEGKGTTITVLVPTAKGKGG
ncbi:sensor histidine kinase [Siminovitchia fortis]|uniref:sensor histidine kinase n=1 Tax=Siminovitchia fortis TaxID=254758 RepID=UPI00119E9F9F|nr:GAF domain-containing sensor histidine kinase [Siminovitchia fortis]